MQHTRGTNSHFRIKFFVWDCIMDCDRKHIFNFWDQRSWTVKSRASRILQVTVFNYLFRSLVAWSCIVSFTAYITLDQSLFGIGFGSYKKLMNFLESTTPQKHDNGCYSPIMVLLIGFYKRVFNFQNTSIIKASLTVLQPFMVSFIGFYDDQKFHKPLKLTTIYGGFTNNNSIMTPYVIIGFLDGQKSQKTLCSR